MKFRKSEIIDDRGKSVKIRMRLVPNGNLGGNRFYNPDVIPEIMKQKMFGGKTINCFILMYLYIEAAKGSQMNDFQILEEGPAIVGAKRTRVEKSDTFTIEPYIEDEMTIGPACPPAVIPENVEVVYKYSSKKFVKVKKQP